MEIGNEPTVRASTTRERVAAGWPLTEGGRAHLEPERMYCKVAERG
jgi:hypothetical protein